MSIESNPSSVQSRTTPAAAQHSSKHASKTGAGATDASGGFSQLMNLLAADDSTLNAVAPDDGASALPTNDLSAGVFALANTDSNANTISVDSSALAATASTLTATDTSGLSNLASDGAAGKPGEMVNLLSAPAGLAMRSDTWLQRHPHGAEIRPETERKSALTDTASNKLMGASAATDLSARDFLTPTKPTSKHSTATIPSSAFSFQTIQQESKPIPELQQSPPLADAARSLQIAAALDLFSVSREKTPLKPGSNSSANALESAFGSIFTPPGAAGSDYQIAQTEAVVPQAALAETLSYWVSHDVKNAELTLEGFGQDPVEVSISLKGDQAQIDFRCSQPEVRQALEGATAQLKEMLSNQGLNLASVSVGTSARDGAPGDAPKHRQENKKPLFVTSQTAAVVGAGVARTSMGRSLDIFV
jgi:flagellar hook-length control protein FliK